MLRELGLVLVLLLSLSGTAQAGTMQEPEFADACGQANAEQVTPAWADICSGWFAGGGAQPLSVTLKLAGDLEDRPQDYLVAYTVGDCHYQLLHQQESGATTAGPATVGNATTDQLNVACGQPKERPCRLGETQSPCSDPPPRRTFSLPAGSFSFSGDTVRWQVAFTGHLAEFAAGHGSSAVLRRPYAAASPDISPTGIYGMSYCYGDQCGSFVSDYAIGRDYTVQ